MNLPPIRVQRPHELATQAFAGVIARALRERRQPLIRGLSESCFERLLKQYFSDLNFCNGTATSSPGAYDEFDEIVELLLEHRASECEQERWLAHAIASAAMGENHLWQDMGLANRAVLSQLMARHFPRLAAKNSGDMKWKKFFYRELCGRAGIAICKSPHCGECCDYPVCFGPELA